MESPAATRVWRVCKAAGQEFPIPEAAEGDEVLGYLIREAVYLQTSREDREAEEKAYEEAQKREFKKGRPGDGLPGSM